MKNNISIWLSRWFTVWNFSTS